jgi:histidinol dehydrogenase
MKILSSSQPEFETVMQKLLSRRHRVMDQLLPQVDELIARYRAEGEKVLVELARERDQVDLIEDDLWVAADAIKNSHKILSPETRKGIEASLDRIERIQSELKPVEIQMTEESGMSWGTALRPLDRVGIYVPGGRAYYFLTLLLTAVPAKLAGVKEMIVVSPPRKKLRPPHMDGLLLYAAKLLGIERILLAGGPTAMAALAFGTKNSLPVQKIVGSGGKLSMVAKHRLAGYVGLDHFAGPPELCIIADKKADPRLIAADLIARADRDAEVSGFVFHTDAKWIQKLVDQVTTLLEQVKDVASREAIQKSLESNCHFFIIRHQDEALDWVNKLAPGTLCLHSDRASELLEQVRSAGCVLMGASTTPVASDLLGGAVGLISTLGGADWAHALSPATFMRRFHYAELSEEALRRAQETTLRLAAEEGFVTHDLPFRFRLE